MATESAEQKQGGDTSSSENVPAKDSNSESSKIEDASGTNLREVEWQFDAAELSPIEEWLGEFAKNSSDSTLEIGSGETKNLTDTYYDTKDWLLYRAGYALRIRQRGKSAEATMKSLSPGDAGVRERREISEPLEIGEILTLRKSGGKVSERLRTLVGGRDLRQLFEVRTHRRAFEIRLDGSENSDQKSGGDEAPVEVFLDEIEIPLGQGEESARLWRVEVEALPEAISEDLRYFVKELRSTHGLSRTRISKYDAGIYATGLVPEEQSDLGPTRIDSYLLTGEMAFAVLRRQFAALQEHEPGVRLGEDLEATHEMRLTSRRLSTAIKLFSEALPERARWLEGELRWFSGVLGEVRDLDVELERLRAWAASEQENAGDTTETTVSEDLIEAVEERRKQARKRVLEALDSGRYERLISSLSAMLRRGPVKDDGKGSISGARITKSAPELLSRRYGKFRKAAERVKEVKTGDAPADAYHELSEKGESLRYALEFHREIYGSSVKSLIRSLKSLQDDLERHQETMTAAERLRELGGTDGKAQNKSPSNAAIFAMGAYAERHRHEAAELQAGLPKTKAFKKLRSRDTQKELEKELGKLDKTDKKSGKKS